MSRLLESRLDPQRRCECALHDAEDEHRAFCFLNPLTQENVMRHHAVKSSRVFAQGIAAEASVETTEFEITTVRFGQPDQIERGTFPGSLAADLYAVERGGPGAVVIVRPANWFEQAGGAA